MSFIIRFSKAAAIAVATLTLIACSELMSRSDFEARVKEKAEHEVRKDIGKPAAVDSTGDLVKWTYVNRTFNIDDANKFDARTVVVFSPSHDGSLKAREIHFE
ncbi:MAG TPA: hypothetical protein VHP37_05575 [Burkholderiales bacterium]|nr:hypothetical protein [Burkholderiales bacterium]